MAYVFDSALGAWHSFAEWWFTSANLGDIIGIGVIICSIAFAYALSHKSVL